MKFKRLLLLAFITVMVIPLTACQSSTAAYDSSKKNWARKSTTRSRELTRVPELWVAHKRHFRLII